MPLDRQLRNEIVEFLLPFMDTRNNRQAILNQALFGEAIIDQIEIDGDPRGFTDHLVTKLYQYGNETALIVLLESLRDRVGESRKAEINELVKRLQALPESQGLTGKPGKLNRLMNILRDNIWNFVGVVVAVVAIVIGLITSGRFDTPKEPTSQPTPLAPRITAIQNMNIHYGPGADFDQIAVLSVGNALDILGISEDKRWYQVLLPDGNTGWVVVASSGGEVSGALGTIAVIVPTETAIPTLTRTPVSTGTAIPSHTPTATPSATETPTFTETTTQTPTDSPQWYVECMQYMNHDTPGATQQPRVNGVIATGEWANWNEMVGSSTSACGIFSIYHNEVTSTNYAAVVICDDDLTPGNLTSLEDTLTVDIVGTEPGSFVVSAPQIGRLPNRISARVSPPEAACFSLEMSYREPPDDSGFAFTFSDIDADGNTTNLISTVAPKEN